MKKLIYNLLEINYLCKLTAIGIETVEDFGSKGSHFFENGKQFARFFMRN
jgi:hypothetical protein